MESRPELDMVVVFLFLARLPNEVGNVSSIHCPSKKVFKKMHKNIIACANSSVKFEKFKLGFKKRKGKSRPLSGSLPES